MENSGMKTYFNEMRKTQVYPKTEFEHAYSMLDTSHEEEMQEFSQIVEKQVLLATISDDALMRLIQNDIHLLTNMFDMAMREDEFKEVLRVCYFAWRGELMITRTKDGTERKLQGAVQPSYHPSQSIGGYSMPQQEDQREVDAINRLLRRKKNNQETRQ
jgi:hypothetical protein